jgi:putative membrane protein
MRHIRVLLVAWLLNFIVLWVAFAVVGSASASGVGALVAAAAVFGLLNMFLKPVLMLIGLPLRIITFGLVTFLINMAMVAITAGVVDGIQVGGFVSVVTVALVMWAANMVLMLAVGAGRVAARA